ncbi:hypothetical protein BGZ51_002291 [Haplosporangium sp. Z 767]|nr:hypothetical protein BGZ51_002291 [Haplosporangium sp. Z 767]KAF9190730.1 hypothetical protein BGZ50_009871 [Haplosporangium sp. Z 11]
MLQVALSLLSASTTHAAPLLELNITITRGGRKKSDKIYHWEFDSFPSSLSQLEVPLQLETPLKPGRDMFDIVRDPVPIKSQSLSKAKLPRVLRSLYPAHSYARSKDRHPSFTSTPLPKEAFSGPASRYIRLEYQMLFKPGFNWVKGGKLPGALIGSEKGCNAGCSGGGSAENCFSTRMMWRANGQGELYLYAAKSVYFPNQKPEICRSSLNKRSPEALFLLEKRHIDAVRIPEDDEFEFYEDGSNGALMKRAMSDSCLNGMRVQISKGARNMCNPNYGISIGRGGGFQFKSGQWHNVTQIVRVNSKGKAVRDGYLAIYLDHKPVIVAQDLVLLKNGYDPKKDSTRQQVKFMFSSFFGGATKDYATPNDQWIAWKGFKMTTSSSNIWE